MKLSNIDPSQPGAWGLLIRHAERHSIAGHGFGLDVELTDAGRAAARVLGADLSAMPWNPVRVSPLLRCRQTAVELWVGCGRSTAEAEGSVISDPLLAAAYVDDPEAVQRSFAATRPEDVILAHLRGETIDGLRSIAEGSELLLAGLLPHLEPSTLTIFVTHDALVLPLQCHYGSRKPSAEDWVGYLEGSVLYAEGETVTIDDVSVPLPAFPEGR